MSDPNEIRGLVPSLADWWRARKEMPPTLVLCCGIDGCPKRVGEVKTDGVDAYALMLNRFGERTVPYTPRISEESLGFPPGTVLRDSKTGETLSEQQDRKFEELDGETIRYVEGSRRLAKRYNATPVVLPLDVIGHIVCPEHGMVVLPNADQVVVDMRSFLASPGVKHAGKYRYAIFGGSSVE